MADTPDWQAHVLARLTNTTPDMVDTTDPNAWLLAYATLAAHHGETDPPEVLADLVQRVDGIERNLHGLTLATESMSKAVWEQFSYVNDQFKKIIDALTKRRPRDRAVKPPSGPRLVSDLFAPPPSTPKGETNLGDAT